MMILRSFEDGGISYTVGYSKGCAKGKEAAAYAPEVGGRRHKRAFWISQLSQLVNWVNWGRDRVCESWFVFVERVREKIAVRES